MAINRQGKFRCFVRKVWRRNADWPEGYEPQAVPADRCRTLAMFDNENDARQFCGARNAAWRQHHGRLQLLSPTKRRFYFEAGRYEYEEV